MKGVSTAMRSRYMAAVKSRGNQSTEIKLIGFLREHKLIGWRRHYATKGTPDFCWPKKKLAIFVDGCFWHGCPRCYKSPKSNVKFWKAKIDGNRKRDLRVNSALRGMGWMVIRIWECRLNDKRAISRIKRLLENCLCGTK